jgi:polyisoprenoid-binding protein YceI
LHGYSFAGIAESSSGRARAGGALAAAALVWLAACAPAGRPPPDAERVAPVAAAAAGAVRYRIDPARSEVRILVYRTGPLARLGHNHVLAVRELAGEVWLPADPAGARFSLSFPVAALAVDEPAARREEGEEFASEPSAADVAGTRRNLEGPAVLDAARYPSIRLDGVAARGPLGLIARARLVVRDHSAELELPVEVSVAPGELDVRGGFTVLQGALGIEPFSAALGALRVRDDLAVRFRLVAVPDPAG